MCDTFEESNREFGKLRKGAPVVHLVELPRLKLSFTTRLDHDKVPRLFSVDHVDLFISNERPATMGKMLAGIPHSLILSNARGETQVRISYFHFRS